MIKFNLDMDLKKFRKTFGTSAFLVEFPLFFAIATFCTTELFTYLLGINSAFNFSERGLLSSILWLAFEFGLMLALTYSYRSIALGRKKNSRT